MRRSTRMAEAGPEADPGEEVVAPEPQTDPEQEEEKE